MSHDGPRKRKSFRWMHTLLFILVLFGIFHIGSQVREYRQMLEIKEQYTSELAAATAVYEEKQDEIALLNDDAYVARIAREKLGMLREGEKSVVITEKQED